MKPFFYLLLGIASLCLNACASLMPTQKYTKVGIPLAPNYANLDYWAAHPEKKDQADQTPEPYLSDEQAQAAVDVFFLHPTTYVGSKGEDQWNGPVDDSKLNQKTDDGTILFQASVFNGSGKIYAPRYRQAHLHSYYAKDTLSAKKAFELAYEDVEAAFEYYLSHFNQGRPFIIASHSQGTTHAIELIQKKIDQQTLQKQFVAAYLVGMPVVENTFKSIKACENPEEVGCFCAWRSWLKGYYPNNFQKNNNIVVTNPILWTTTTTYADKTLNEGTILRKFNKGFKKQITDAQVHDGVLWVTKPKFFGSIFINWKNYHIADFNLYYANIRKNAQKRVKIFLSRSQ